MQKYLLHLSRDHLTLLVIDLVSSLAKMEFKVLGMSVAKLRRLPF
jgi:hypothetical protein